MSADRFSIRWSLHEQTQCACCRAAFIVLGALPLLLVFSFVCLQYAPAYQQWQARRCENWLQQQLGLKATIAAVEALAPHRLKLHGVKLAHPETGATVGRLRQVELCFTTSGCVVRLGKPEFDARQLRTASKIVHDWFVCRPDRYALAISITVDEAEPGDRLNIFSSEAESVTFRDVQVALHPIPDAVVAIVRFARVDFPRADPIVLMVKRNHDENQPETKIELRTGTTPLPCWLLAEFEPAIEALGAGAEFTGQLRLSANGEHLRADIQQASITGINIGRWTSCLSSPLTGLGNLILERATFSQAGLESADGQLRVSTGRISQRLLLAAHQYLGVELSDGVKVASVSAQSFENFGLSFQFSSAGLQLVGLLGRRPGEATDSGLRFFLSDSQGASAATAYMQPLPIENLIATCNTARETVVTASGGQTSAPTGMEGWKIVKWFSTGQPRENDRVSRASVPQDHPSTATQDSSVQPAIYR